MIGKLDFIGINYYMSSVAKYEGDDKQEELSLVVFKILI